MQTISVKIIAALTVILIFLLIFFNRVFGLSAIAALILVILVMSKIFGIFFLLKIIS